MAGAAPLPDDPTLPLPTEPDGKTVFQLGFEYGRADALERFEPDS